MGITVKARGQNGEILVEDEREDGAQIFLVCRPFGDVITGVFVGPGEPPVEDRKKIYRYPMVERAVATRRDSPFKITLDTSGLPSGPLEFRAEQFIARAQELSDTGADHALLRIENLKDWGLITPGEFGSHG